MTTTLFANPYDISASGFYFTSMEEYDAKSAALRNECGQPVEEFEIDYIDGDDTVFERGPIERLSQDGQLAAFQHHGFWHGMDTLWDKIYLDGLWEKSTAPWKIWKE